MNALPLGPILLRSKLFSFELRSDRCYEAIPEFYGLNGEVDYLLAVNINTIMPNTKKTMFARDTPINGGAVPLREIAIPARNKPQYIANSISLIPKPIDFSLLCALIPKGMPTSISTKDAIDMFIFLYASTKSGMGSIF